MSELDAELLQDFLTETAELLEQLDADLLQLESAQNDAAPALLDSIFRALHTVKGAAGFLGLEVVTTFAHAAEDALNRLRKGEIAVTPHVTDLLLKSVDILRGMTDALAAGDQPVPCPPQLIAQLNALADADADAATGAADESAEVVDEARGEAHPLELPPQKQDLLEFMTDDLRDAAGEIDQCIETAKQLMTRGDAGEHLCEVAEAMRRTAEFFELADVATLVDLLAATGAAVGDLPDDVVAQLLPRLTAIRQLVEWQADALAQRTRLTWPLETFADRIHRLIRGETINHDPVPSNSEDASEVLRADAVIESAVTEGATDSEGSTDTATTTTDGESTNTPDEADNAPGEAGEAPSPAVSGGRKPAVEQTIRVEVSRLEAMLNLVGQLVLTKNRFSSLARRFKEHGGPQELMEELTGASNDLDRLTGNLQMGVMRTRMQPMAKLFDRYGRVIRDIARTTGKQIELAVTGRGTEVDKSMLEFLADPLVHILRNSADHGIESPDDRRAAQKPPTGTICLDAEHQGSHVRVAVSDDGRGISRELVTRKAIEKNLATAEQLETMSDEDVLGFIFAPGFSTAGKISGLSGRGVGMDVVHTNVAKLNGSVHVRSTPGAGTTIEIFIPLTVAIMPAMLVGVGRHVYCIPIQSIIEIVRPEPETRHTVNGDPVIRLRDQVLPLLDLRTRLGEDAVGHPGRFAVVVGAGDRRLALVVDSLVGQQEVVIKPLEDAHVQGGPFSGATIGEDGDVSLILDIVQLIRDSTTAGPIDARSTAA